MERYLPMNSAAITQDMKIEGGCALSRNAKGEGGEELVLTEVQPLSLTAKCLVQ